MGNTASTLDDENTIKSRTSTLHSQHKNKKCETTENSRALFLLYLIHKTWTVVIESVDLKSKR